MNDTLKISKRQKEILVGKLLGDAHAETQTSGRTYRIKFEHSYRQKDYVDWLYREFKSLAASPPQAKEQLVSGNWYKKYWFNTKYSSSFRFYAQQFYQGRTKQIPVLIYRWLSPLTLAVWFMDDGSVKSNKHRAKIINTQRYRPAEVERVIMALKSKYGVKAQLRKQKEGHQIYLLSETIERFEAIIRSYVVPSMQYKLG